MAKASRKGMARQNKAVVAKWAGGEADQHRPCSKNSRQMKWPAQALQQKHSRQMKRRAQALQQKQPADDPTGTGLAAKTASR